MLVATYMSNYLNSPLLAVLILMVAGACGALIGAVVGWATWRTYARPRSGVIGRWVLFIGTLCGVFGLWVWIYGLAQLGNYVGMAVCFTWSVVAAWSSAAKGRKIAQVQ